jgi:amicyanin
MNQIRRSAVAVGSGLILTVVTACSSSSGSPGAGAIPKNTVVIKDFKYTPASLSVAVGTKVTFINEDPTPHTATGTGSSASINSGNLNQNQRYTVTFSKAGTYSYSCTIHPYMKGTVVVH